LFWGIQERLPLMFRKTKTLYNIFEHDDNQLNQQHYSRSSTRIQERLVGGLRPPFVQPLMFRKTKTLYNIFEHDDNQLNQQHYSRFANTCVLHLFSFKTPPLGAVMSEKGGPLCALWVRKGVISHLFLNIPLISRYVYYHYISLHLCR